MHEKVAAARWEVERVFVDGDEFFDDLLTAIEAARHFVIIECYIFKRDELGDRVIKALIGARQRGVDVRVLVDGIGSWDFRARYGAQLEIEGVSFKIYNELPRFWPVARRRTREPTKSYWRSLLHVNKRDHRKVYIVDGKRAWVGSMNVVGVHVRSVAKDAAWRDTGAAVEGAAIADLIAAFDRVWIPFGRRTLARMKRHGRGHRYGASGDLVRLSIGRRRRISNYRRLLSQIAYSDERVWITNGYFVPQWRLIRALREAARRGVDVRLLLPYRSDVFFIPWVSRVFYGDLVGAGVKVYEYTASILHAKTMLIDSVGLVGSSNLNSRSLKHDLEVDVVLHGKQSLAILQSAFERDIESSARKIAASLTGCPWYERWLGRLCLIFRYWI